jgi:ribokinase
MSTIPTIFVSGLINLETTLQVDGFPINYTPVRYPFFGVNSSVSGVGYNIAKALTTLGSRVRFASIIGTDQAGILVRQVMTAESIPDEFVIEGPAQTAHSVIIFDGKGKRQINVDLKDIQQQTYPESLYERAVEGCSLVSLCNINFSRPLLHKARLAEKLITTDVHTISDLNDDYNRDFMRYADILFMSHEKLPAPAEEWAKAVQGQFGTAIVVIGLGGDGALLAVRGDGFIGRIPARQILPVVNTIGAGDALFSAFLHSYTKTNDPYTAIRKAILFASYKVGATGAADGFLTESQLEGYENR